MSRASVAMKNSFVQMAVKIYQLIMPFLIRTVLLYYLGAEYTGLDGLFISVLQVLNLAELGVGSAMTYSMYRPIKENDEAEICRLLNLYRTYYRIIGAVIGIAGICLIPFLPLLIKSDIPADLNLTVVYLMNLAVTVLTYWMFSYKNSLFQACQRLDVAGYINLGAYTVKYLLQIISIMIFRSYYVYLISNIIAQILTNILIEVYSVKYFPQYLPEGHVSQAERKEVNGRIRDLFTAKVGTVIVNSTDSIVISSFMGLIPLAIYQNYYLILSSVVGVLSAMYAALIPSIGQSFIEDNKKKNFHDLQRLTFCMVWIISLCTALFGCLYQPFIELWAGKKYLLHYSAVAFFCLYFYIQEINHILNTFKDASGLWHTDRFRPLITALSNLLISVLLVGRFGIYGVLAGTILATVLIGMPWLIHNLFHTVFEPNKRARYLSSLLKYTVVTLISFIICVYLGELVSGPLVFVLIVRALICIVVVCGINLIVYQYEIRKWNMKALAARFLHLKSAESRK